MKQTVHPRGGWQQEENDLLFAAVRDAAAEGRPLRDVFARVGEELHRKPNSIRNYYYAKVKDEPQLAPSKVTFRAFDQEELHQLLRDVLMAKGRGESVRACVIRRAQGDRSAMLRYQNKYRSVLKNRPELLLEVAEELRREGLPCPEDVVSFRRYSPAEQASGLPAGWEKEPAVLTVLEGLGMLLRRMDAQAAALRERAEAEQQTILQECAAPMMPADDLSQPMIFDELPCDPAEKELMGDWQPEASAGQGDVCAADAEPVEAISEEMGNAGESAVGGMADGLSRQSAAPVMQVPYDKWLKTRQEADRLRVEVDLLKIALEEAEQGKAEQMQE